MTVSEGLIEITTLFMNVFLMDLLHNEGCATHSPFEHLYGRLWVHLLSPAHSDITLAQYPFGQCNGLLNGQP